MRNSRNNEFAVINAVNNAVRKARQQATPKQTTDDRKPIRMRFNQRYRIRDSRKKGIAQSNNLIFIPQKRIINVG